MKGCVCLKLGNFSSLSVVSLVSLFVLGFLEVSVWVEVGFIGMSLSFWDNQYRQI
jgi:hypothetical protein